MNALVDLIIYFVIVNMNAHFVAIYDMHKTSCVVEYMPGADLGFLERGANSRY